MNCLDFRRDCLTDPYRLTAEHRAHMQACEACARFAQRQAEFDLQLDQAMRVPVPDTLGSEVIFERSFRGSRWRHWLAVAAVMVLALAGALSVFLADPATGMGQQMIAHMEHDPLHDMPAAGDAQASLAQVANRLRIGLDPATLEGRIVHAKLCDVNGHKGLHMVLENADGTRATVFIMPAQARLDSAWLEANAQQGMLLPSRQGVIAVFCPRSADRAQLLALGERLERAVTWPG